MNFAVYKGRMCNFLNAKPYVIFPIYGDSVKDIDFHKHRHSRSVSGYQPAVYQANGPLLAVKASPQGCTRPLPLGLKNGGAHVFAPKRFLDCRDVANILKNISYARTPNGVTTLQP